MLLRAHRAKVLFVTIAIGAAAFAFACSDPASGPHVVLLHPDGVVHDSLLSDQAVVGVSLSRSGAIALSQIFGNDIRIGSITPFTFASTIGTEFAPVDVALTQDGTTAFVANFNSSTVSIVDVFAGTQTSTLPVPSPLRTLLSPDGTRLYVTQLGSSSTSSVHVFDAGSHALLDTISVGALANGIAFDSARKRLYVSTQSDSSIYEINATTDAVIRRIPVGGVPQDIAVTPDHAELWVADSASGVRVFNIANGRLIASIPALYGAFGLAISPDGARVYVTMTTRASSAIVDRPERVVLSTLLTGPSPARVAFSASGSNAVITDVTKGAYLIR